MPLQKVVIKFWWHFLPVCITLDPRLQKHMSYMKSVFTFIQIEACQKACTSQNYFHKSLYVCCQIMLTQNSLDM